MEYINDPNIANERRSAFTPYVYSEEGTEREFGQPMTEEEIALKTGYELVKSGFCVDDPWQEGSDSHRAFRFLQEQYGDERVIRTSFVDVLTTEVRLGVFVKGLSTAEELENRWHAEPN